MCFVWISEQTAIISLHNINWLVCLTEMEYVYCAVRIEYLNVIRINFLIQTDNEINGIYYIQIKEGRQTGLVACCLGTAF